MGIHEIWGVQVVVFLFCLRIRNGVFFWMVRRGCDTIEGFEFKNKGVFFLFQCVRWVLSLCKDGSWVVRYFDLTGGVSVWKFLEYRCDDEDEVKW